MISMIVAMANDRVIGKDNAMPWHIPEDLKWFRKHTLGKPVVMGRKTYQSIGMALPKRRNIILSRQQNLQIPGCEVFHDVNDVLALSAADNEIMIIGGGELYRIFLPYASRLYLTEIDQQLEGDTCFPEYDEPLWELVFSESRVTQAEFAIPLVFKILQKQRFVRSDS